MVTHYSMHILNKKNKGGQRKRRKDFFHTVNKIKYFLDNSLMLITALAPKIGYDNAAKIAKNALKNKTTLKTEALKSGLITDKDYNKIVDPKKMIYPE